MAENPYEAPQTSVSQTAPQHERSGKDATRLSDLSPQQWKSGAAAWLGWLFDGLDMHLYTLVATIFVADLLHTDIKNSQVGYYSSWIQAAFLIGWALGGGVFGIIGDRLGRTRTLMLTIITYALFTALSYFAQTWWHLLIFRFLAALGIGGEWAVGASLLSETWPHRWRPWMAAILQTAVNCGTLLASLAVLLLADYHPRTVFLVGVLPALLVLWIRKAVPETEEWHEARSEVGFQTPPFGDLFRNPVRRTTILTLLVCGFGLTAHWALMFWCSQHIRNLPEIGEWSDAERSALVSQGMTIIMVASIVGNFLAAMIARRCGYRRTITWMCLAYFASMLGSFIVPREFADLRYWLVALGLSSGVFALFTMYLPPLFPTLLRTTGAGFCYNTGRIAAALGTVFFGLFTKVGDYRLALLYASFLFLPAAAVAYLLPEMPESDTTLVEPVE